MFTADNTYGYTDQQLADMNEQLSKQLIGYDRDTDEYQQAVKHFSERILTATDNSLL
jgi:hypothetical protein